MLWLVALFIVLQPGIFSKKNIPVKMEDILLRALIFGLIVYFLQGLTEGFQTAEVNPTLPPPEYTEPPPPGYTGPPPPVQGPAPPQGYQQAAFFEQGDINRGFDMLDANLTQLSYAIKNLFNRSAPPPPPII